jgi:hypothetical protein
MANDFILVTSTDWSEVPDAAAHIENNIGVQTLQNMINDSDWPGILTSFNDVWVPPEGYLLDGARILNDDIVRLWVKLIPV